MAERHLAFGEVVRRFQDLAFACACAHLRDPALAEDAAQDAFLVAWERLDQLRQPAAFPAWIRRLVLTQCHRRLRGTRLELRPAEEAHDVASPVDAAVDLEATGEAALVRFALAQLAPTDRLVLILFYGSQRSQAEIASWLCVPTTTIARRLAHAKRRLRRHTLGALSGGFRAQRKAAGEIFVMEFSSRLRRADGDDAAAIASLATHLAVDRASRRASAPSIAYLVEEPASGTPIAYASATQTIYKPIYDLQLAISDDALEKHGGDVLLTQIVQDVVACDAITLQHRMSARRRALVEFLTSRGFEIVQRAQDWRLAAGARLSEVKTSIPGNWEFKGLETLSQEPALFNAALELLTETIEDSPSGHALLPIHPDTFGRVLRLQRHGVLAVADGTVHGLLTSSRDDLLPEAARLDIVLVRKSRRRQGLATTLLARLLAQQAGTAIRFVAGTTPELRSWLTECGFVHVADTVMLERLLRKTVAVASDQLNEYVGRYVVEAMPNRPIIIERHGDSLVSKSWDMRDVLLASSETEFFTRHHYGQGRFERDRTGRIARLVVCEGTQEVIAVRR